MHINDSQDISDNYNNSFLNFLINQFFLIIGSIIVKYSQNDPNIKVKKLIYYKVVYYFNNNYFSNTPVFIVRGRSLEINQLIRDQLITTTSSLKGCSAWIDEV